MKKLISLAIIYLSIIVNASSSEQLPVLKVTFPGSSLNYSEYIQGEMMLQDPDGETVTLPARFKTRGATALQYFMKPSFNMKLENEAGEEFDTNLLGIREASSWILDAMAIDRICMRNRVCFDIWNSYSKLPYATDFDSRNGTSGKFVIVYMNDEYKGIYCLNDKINRKLLDLKKPKIADNGEVTYRGVLYKNGTTDIGNQETPGFFNNYMVYVAQWHDAWELKEPDDYPSQAAWKPLVNFYDNMNNTWVSRNFFEDNLTDYTLLIMALSVADNWGYKNKYFSMKNFTGDDEERKFIVTPWDLDTSLGGNFSGDNYDGNFSDWEMEQIANSALLPFSICFTKEGKEKLGKRWQQLRETAFSVKSVADRLYAYCDLFINSGAWAQYVDFWNKRTDRPKYVADLRKEIDLIVDWYSNRFSQIDKYFNISQSSVSTTSENDKKGLIFNLDGVTVNEKDLVKGKIYIRDGKKFMAN